MKKTKRRAKLLLVLLVLGISIGYAVLQSNLTINGTTGINNPTWDIHWEHVSVTTGSVTGSNVTQAATIDSVKTTVNYNIKLPKPGDFYEFTVDAINDGTIDAMIDTIDSKLNGTTITSLPSYLTYSVTYSDDTPLAVNHELRANTSETYKVRIEFKKDIDNSQLPSTVQSLNLSFSVVYKQANNNAAQVHVSPRYFAYGTPTTSSTTDYTVLNEKAFIALQDSEYFLCIVIGSELNCFDYEDYYKAQDDLDQVFTSENCEEKEYPSQKTYNYHCELSSGEYCEASRGKESEVSNGIACCDSDADCCKLYYDGRVGCDW